MHSTLDWNRESERHFSEPPTPDLVNSSLGKKPFKLCITIHLISWAYRFMLMLSLIFISWLGQHKVITELVP
jgi:hypothetical protein